jgi:hypothetical protein
MGSMSRSIRRKKAKAEKKAAKKKLKKVMGAIDHMPDYCHKCAKNTSDAEDDKMEWYVEIGHSGDVRLTCPKCRGDK